MDIHTLVKEGHKTIKRKGWNEYINVDTLDIDKMSSDDLFAKDWEYNDEITVKPTFEKNWCYKITDPNHPKYGTTLWSGRYTAVTGIVIKKVKNENTIRTLMTTGNPEFDYYILANLRGPGTPDYQGYWNMPCGFLESNETGEEGVCREIFEECGYKILPGQMELFDVETDPRTCNNGNVTIRYSNVEFCNELPELKYTNINGEEGEVESVKWINVRDINKYKWAFNHKKLIIDALWKLCDIELKEKITK
jgi:ADP-ribose pyrophosphatase YjhB (NUDIX family)